jgi:predicted RNA-binding Zn ribbon-like protein
MNKTRTTKDSDWKDGFLFLGNQRALDFANTCPVQEGKPMELLPDFTALLRWFQAADLLSACDAARLQKHWGGSARARRLVEGMRELREKLRKQILAWALGGSVHQSAVDELNQLMAAHPMHTRLKASRTGFEKELYVPAEQPEDLFAPIAYSAAELFAGADRERVRKCDVCVLHFLDTSKKGTRRWCSMNFCGNRRKVAAYAARKRKEQG